MGYKLAGFDVLGGVEIDPEMIGIYRANHSPRHSYLMGVQEFNKVPDADLPQELFNLDILDGSPPCSSFSMAGSREDAWGKEKKFREGQANQVLDDLFFHFIETAKKLKPSVVVAENVKGLIQGNAKGYVKEIFAQFSDSGYDCQLFLLNSSAMGVPQARERVFFLGRRKDLGFAPIAISFQEELNPLSKSLGGCKVEEKDYRLTQKEISLFIKTSPGECFSKHHPRGSYFNANRTHPDRPAPTIAGSAKQMFHWKERRRMSCHEQLRIQSFPEDFDFCKSDIRYVLGMSVPPLMMQRVADQIAKQWFGVADA